MNWEMKIYHAANIYNDALAIDWCNLDIDLHYFEQHPTTHIC